MPERLITADPGCRPVIAGTHVTVEEVLKELAGSEAVDVILTAHPELDRDAVQAALTFAAEAVHRTASALSVRPSPEKGHFVPRTEFGRELLALREKANKWLRVLQIPLTSWRIWSN